VALVLAVGLWAIVSRTNAEPGVDDCAARTPLRVVADPAISSALTTALRSFNSSCASVMLESSPAATVASALSRPQGTGLDSKSPDVWVSDSRVWVDLVRATDAGATRLTRDQVRLASSPVVVALDAEKARASGWPDSPADWRRLAADGEAARSGSADPRTSSAAVYALFSTIGERADAAAITSLGGRLSVFTGPRSPAELVVDDDVDAIPTYEADVLRAQQASTSGDEQVVASYDPRLDAVLDFPAVLVGNDDDKSARTKAFEALTSYLTTAQPSLNALAAAGLRSPEGELPERYRDAEGVQDERLATTAPLEPMRVTEALRAWSASGRRVRMTLVVDRSGSMLEPLPNGRVSKSELAIRSIRQLIATASPDSDLALRTFTTNGAAADSRAVVPLRRLSSTTGGVSQRIRLLGALPQIAPVRAGDTPLYRAVLDSYADAQSTYAYGKLNVVVVVTDGKNDHPAGRLTEAQTINELRLRYDGIRPVRIVTLGYGSSADIATLRKLADVTGGEAYQGVTEKEVSSLLSSVLSEL
jgi:hypothetical protein